MWPSIFWGLVDLLAPPRCLSCWVELEPGGHGFCRPCNELLEPTQGSEAALAAYFYVGPIAQAVKALKFEGRSEVAPFLARLICPFIQSLRLNVDAIVPVPLHQERLRERGYDQVGLIARALARLLRIPVHHSALVRTRPTEAQSKLGREARLENVKGAFALHHNFNAKGGRFLLLDDVRTTGATISEAEKALREGGALFVHGFAVAITPKDLSV
ncbi:MAG: ComF family protein [Deltaproteobacteria bacterium]|nr:ComF family protein [Sandaracinaceae bacterium]MCX7807097.1 ComF family protein [Deltaproteobacteria bacterium]MDW8245106.1 ComF family protein [Sandaracinaceae bacterium]